VVVHVLDTHEAAPTRVGFVVNKQVGNAVTRNRVKRRLRHLMRGPVAALPRGLQVVVRATPLAASRPGRLAGDLAACWRGAVERASAGVPALEWAVEHGAHAAVAVASGLPEDSCRSVGITKGDGA